MTVLAKLGIEQLGHETVHQLDCGLKARLNASRDWYHTMLARGANQKLTTFGQTVNIT